MLHVLDMNGSSADQGLSVIFCYETYFFLQWATNTSQVYSVKYKPEEWNEKIHSELK